MEPVRGGRLANLPERGAAVLAAADPDASQASWAYRYCLEAALPYPSKCSTASTRWSMMSMDWGHMASQVPHWMHFEAGPSAACQE